MKGHAPCVLDPEVLQWAYEAIGPVCAVLFLLFSTAGAKACFILVLAVVCGEGGTWQLNFCLQLLHGRQCWPQLGLCVLLACRFGVLSVYLLNV